MANFLPASISKLALVRVFDASSDADEQLPTGLGLANARQIEFGAAKSGKGFTLDDLGTLTITSRNNYSIAIGVHFGREGNAGTSELWFYLTVNGVQAGESISYDFDKEGETHYLNFTILRDIPAGAEIKGFVMRDLNNSHDSGGLYRKLSSEGLNPSSTATLRLDRFD